MKSDIRLLSFCKPTFDLISAPQPLAPVGVAFYQSDMKHQHHERLLIIDFGSQVTQLIARRLREAGVYTEILPSPNNGS